MVIFKMNYDFERLRYDLIDYFGTATFSGFPMAMVDLSDVEYASESELVRIAMQNGFNLNDYKKLL